MRADFVNFIAAMIRLVARRLAAIASRRRCRLCRVRGPWEGEGKSASLPLRALDANLPAVGLDDVSGNRQSQAGAFAAGLTGHAEEALEYTVDVVRGNSRSGIAD
jgi:hypothetical protein